jgi:hypothetical protein
MHREVSVSFPCRQSTSLKNQQHASKGEIKILLVAIVIEKFISRYHILPQGSKLLFIDLQHHDPKRSMSLCMRWHFFRNESTKHANSCYDSLDMLQISKITNYPRNEQHKQLTVGQYTTGR